MKLNTGQVADKLGVTKHTVREFRDKGLLTDIAIRKEGKSKHFSLFDSKQVNEFAKTYKKRSRSNGHVSTSPGDGIASRFVNMEKMLVSIDSKLDTIIKMWS